MLIEVTVLAGLADLGDDVNLVAVQRGINLHNFVTNRGNPGQGVVLPYRAHLTGVVELAVEGFAGVDDVVGPEKKPRNKRF